MGMSAVKHAEIHGHRSRSGTDGGRGSEGRGPDGRGAHGGVLGHGQFRPICCYFDQTEMLSEAMKGSVQKNAEYAAQCEVQIAPSQPMWSRECCQ